MKSRLVKKGSQKKLRKKYDKNASRLKDSVERFSFENQQKPTVFLNQISTLNASGS